MNKQEIYKLIEEHYRSYANILVKRLSNKMGSRYEAEDAVQETYTRACQYWQSYDETLKFSNWINGILGNCIKAKMNDIRHHGMVDDVVIDAEVQPPSLNFKIIEEIKKMVELQPENIKRILTLALFNQYSLSDIDKIVSENYGIINWIVNGWRRKLRLLFGGKLYV